MLQFIVAKQVFNRYVISGKNGTSRIKSHDDVILTRFKTKAQINHASIVFQKEHAYTGDPIIGKHHFGSETGSFNFPPTLINNGKP